MRALLVFFIIALFNCSAAEEHERKITCDDIKDNPAGWIAEQLSSNDVKLIDVKFYHSTNQNKKSALINVTDWSQSQTSRFDVTKKTFIIIHGYMSDGQKKWVIDMKDAILDTRDGNVIMVDWSDGGNKKNYVNAARNTVIASNRIFNFLQRLRVEIGDEKSTSSETAYNHLHLIGHSLGAQISGQTAHLIKKDSFWAVDRITGLDPAKPCFSDIDPSLRVDKEHAAFVDIVHTNMGEGLTDSFGLALPLGHLDFYMNGGMVQPECQNGLIEMQKVVCSHKLTPEYFTETIFHSKNESCTFPVQPWDGSYSNALKRIDNLIKGKNCNSCPKMGIDAVKSEKRGIFLVLSGSQEPYCKFDPDKDLPNILPGIEKLTNMKPIGEYADQAKEYLSSKALSDELGIYGVLYNE